MQINSFLVLASLAAAAPTYISDYTTEASIVEVPFSGPITATPTVIPSATTTFGPTTNQTIINGDLSSDDFGPTETSVVVPGVQNKSVWSWIENIFHIGKKATSEASDDNPQPTTTSSDYYAEQTTDFANSEN